MSDYWTLAATVKPVQTFTNFQNGYTPGGAAMVGGSGFCQQYNYKTFTYIWAIVDKGRFVAFVMDHAWGIIHVADRAEIFRRVGWYEGGNVPVEDVMKSMPATVKDGYDSIALLINGSVASSIYGTFENISKFANAKANVMIFRRR